MMNWFNTYFIDVVKNHYLDFEGKANRKQFWSYVLAWIIIWVVLIILGAIFSSSLFMWILWLLAIALLLPNIAIGCRRLRDAGLSPWWMLLLLIPIVDLAVLVMWILPSKGK